MGFSRTRFHSSSRHRQQPPSRRSRTCPLVMRFCRASIPPPWFDETPPPPTTRHDKILPPAPSFNETPPITGAHALETPPVPSQSRRWRSGALHIETLVSKRTSSRNSCSNHSASRHGTATVACRCIVHLAPVSKTASETAGPFGSNRETTSIGPSSGDVHDFGEKQWMVPWS